MRGNCIRCVGSSVVRVPASVRREGTHYSVNGECFAFHAVEPPHTVPARVYRTRG